MKKSKFAIPSFSRYFGKNNIQVISKYMEH